VKRFTRSAASKFFISFQPRARAKAFDETSEWQAKRDRLGQVFQPLT
jgi:hypothetical protein